MIVKEECDLNGGRRERVVEGMVVAEESDRELDEEGDFLGVEDGDEVSVFLVEG